MLQPRPVPRRPRIRDVAVAVFLASVMVLALGDVDDASPADGTGSGVVAPHPLRDPVQPFPG